MLRILDRVVVVGAGYGGLRVAQRLSRHLRHSAKCELIVIDRNDYHLIETKLHEVAAGSITPAKIMVPFSDLIGPQVRLIRTKVTGFDFARRVVLTESGEVSYDKLVVALGSETDYFGIPGMDRYAKSLKTVSEAKEIAKHIRDCFCAAAGEADPIRKRSLLTFVVGGGGFTGTELVAEIADRLPPLSREFHIDRDTVRLMVAEGGPAILPGFDPALTRKAMDVLKEKGAELLLGSPAVEAGQGFMRLKSGAVIASETIIWTGGVCANKLISGSGLKTGAKGRAVVNPYLESVDYPSVYIVGDSVLVIDPISNRPVAPSAQVALQEASSVADNLRATIEGAPRRRFVPHLRGEFVSLGSDQGVGVIKGVKISGRLALLLKRANEFRYLHGIGGLRMAIGYQIGTPDEKRIDSDATAEDSADVVARRRRIAK